MAQPLTKTKEDDGTLYTRFPETEAAIEAALGHDLDRLSRRATIRDRKSPDYLPSESLVHLIRDAHRRGKATSRTPSMYVDEKSDEAIVPAKRLNKGRQLPAEVVEGRASPKGNSR
jgi:hypothetical protein